MNPISAFAIFFIIWWVTLFAVLPIGMKTQGEAGTVVPGTHESAPAKPRFAFVISLTTMISLLVFAAFYWFAITKGLRFDDLADFIPAFMKLPGANGS
jgi:predicted secreted protein